MTEAYAYDPSRGWLTSVTGTLPGGDLAFRAGYNRSATGRIFRADTQALVGGSPTDLGGSYDYTYDYTGRLLSATNWRGASAFDQVFAYDRAGRIRAKGATLATATAYAYTDPLKPDHAPGAVTTAGVTTTFTYDANGNMLTGLGGKIMTYDGENRPLSVTHLGKRTCYVYGVDGKRLKKVEGLPPTQDCTALPANANTTVYFSVVEVRNWLVVGAEQVLTYPHPSVKLLNSTAPTAATYLHRDGLASVRAITNAAGVKIESALYKPFGEQSEWVLPGNAAPETKGWIGERYDADAGLLYLNARYYDPELSLFLQPDWFEVTKAGTNRFGYCGGDPINCSDSTGNVPDNWATKDKKKGYDSSGYTHSYAPDRGLPQDSSYKKFTSVNRPQGCDTACIVTGTKHSDGEYSMNSYIGVYAARTGPELDPRGSGPETSTTISGILHYMSSRAVGGNGNESLHDISGLNDQSAYVIAGSGVGLHRGKVRSNAAQGGGSLDFTIGTRSTWTDLTSGAMILEGKGKTVVGEVGNKTSGSVVGVSEAFDFNWNSDRSTGLNVAIAGVGIWVDAPVTSGPFLQDYYGTLHFDFYWDR